MTFDIVRAVASAVTLALCVCVLYRVLAPLLTSKKEDKDD